MIAISPLHTTLALAQTARSTGPVPALSLTPACPPETAEEELARLLLEAAHVSRRNRALEVELQACEVSSLWFL